MNSSNLESATETLLDFDYVGESYGLDVALSRVVEEEGEIPVGTENGFTEDEIEELAEVHREGIFSQVRVGHVPAVVDEYQQSGTFHQAAAQLPEGLDMKAYLTPDGPQYFVGVEAEGNLDSSMFNSHHHTVEKVFRVDDETADWGWSEGGIDYDPVEELYQAAQELPDDLVIPEHTDQKPVEQIEEELDEQQKHVLSENSVWGMDVGTLQTITEQILEDPAYQRATENSDAFRSQHVTIAYNDVTPEHIQEDDGPIHRLAKKLGQEMYDGQRIDSRIDIQLTRKISPQIARRYELRKEDRTR